MGILALLRCLGLSDTDLDIITFLIKHPASSILDIAEGVGLSGSSTWRHLQRLVEAGFVSRRQFHRPGPGRRPYVYFVDVAALRLRLDACRRVDPAAARRLEEKLGLR